MIKAIGISGEFELLTRKHLHARDEIERMSFLKKSKTREPFPHFQFSVPMYSMRFVQCYKVDPD